MSADLAATPRVVLATQLQVRAWQRRLAQTGGAMGVQIGTFATLYREILSQAGEAYVPLSESIQHRLLRLLISDAQREHYNPLRASPGFAQVVHRLIRELKAGGVFPERLLSAIQDMGDDPRLKDLAALYLCYQSNLQANRWADGAGFGWLADEALERNPHIGTDWSCLVVDGFDDLTSVQRTVLRRLAKRVKRLIITWTGAPAGEPSRLMHRRLDRTRARIEADLGIAAEPLPQTKVVDQRAASLIHLEASLLTPPTARPEADGAITLIAAPDREGEVRSALRWLKERLVHDKMPLHEGVLLARSLRAYRPWIDQIAHEYGIPIQSISGVPLRSNPALVALLDLLQIASLEDRSFPWRETVGVWQSHYFDWGTSTDNSPDSPMGITAQDAEMLDEVARWGSVVCGLDQWREAFSLLAQSGTFEAIDEEVPLPETPPIGVAAQALADKFERFVTRVSPPAGRRTYDAFVRWVEDLVGDQESSPERPDTDLGIARRAAQGDATVAERDIAALNALKDVLRGLVWAQKALDRPPVTFREFLDDLSGAINTTDYYVSLPTDREALLVADVAQARGVSFQAVALLGLAEGEFPTAIAEDPFLRDADRRRLRDGFGLEIDLSTESSEAQYFYEAITRARQALCLTRPCIADNGAPWQPSPYWREVQRHTGIEPQRAAGNSYPDPAQAASWTELLMGLSTYGHDEFLWRWVAQQNSERHAVVDKACAVLGQRLAPQDETFREHNGNLSAWHTDFAARFGPSHVWSASRLESYRSCPFAFFVSSILGLQARAAPSEGLDARQLGNIYHHTFEKLYSTVQDPTSLDQLLDTLPGIANQVMDTAPLKEGFRETAWWEQTRQEIVDNIRNSVLALDALRGDYVPYASEQSFGISGKTGAPLIVDDPETGDQFRLRGFIDRVDRAPDGSIRIIDYKTGGYSSYSKKNVLTGKKLQLVLYALAAQHALHLGTISDGFYWHVRHATWHLENAQKETWFRLAHTDVKETLANASAFAWEAVHGARNGSFAPTPPSDGCPGYCPAIGFCWQYSPSSW